MYDAKAKELNSVSIYDDVIAKKIERRLRLKKDLPNAIQNEELFLLYQPQVDSESNKIIGAEAFNEVEPSRIRCYFFVRIYPYRRRNTTNYSNRKMDITAGL